MERDTYNAGVIDLDGVSTADSLYVDYKNQWDMIADCIAGDDRIKSKEQYCPKKYKEDERSYKARKGRATFANFTGRIQMNIDGMLTQKLPEIIVPQEFIDKGYLDNIDMNGTTIYQFTSDMINDNIPTNWGGILVDYPEADPDESVLDAERNNHRPYLTYYSAYNVINWKRRRVNGIKVLSMVVLKEEEDVSNVEFAHDRLSRFRVLELDENNNYVQKIYHIEESKKFLSRETKKEIVKIDERIIYMHNEPMKFIPFITIPGDIPSKSMLYDIAKLNIGHFQKLVDYEYGVHMTTLPTMYTTGHIPGVEDDGTKEEITVGKETMIMLPEAEAKAGILSFAGEGLTHSEKAIANAEAQIGYMFSSITSKDTSTSAESADIHRMGENANLATYSIRISQAMTKALKIMCNWSNMDSSIVSFALSTDFDAKDKDSNMVNSLANLFNTNHLLSLHDVYYVLKNYNIIPKDETYEDYLVRLDLDKAPITSMEANRLFIKYKETGKADIPEYDMTVIDDTKNDKNKGKDINGQV